MQTWLCYCIKAQCGDGAPVVLVSHVQIAFELYYWPGSALQGVLMTIMWVAMKRKAPPAGQRIYAAHAGGGKRWWVGIGILYGYDIGRSGCECPRMLRITSLILCFKTFLAGFWHGFGLFLTELPFYGVWIVAVWHFAATSRNVCQMWWFTALM